MSEIELRIDASRWIRLELTNPTDGGSRFGTVTSNLRDDLDDLHFFLADVIESLVLAHACNRIAVGDAKYIDGIRIALDAIENNL